MSENPSEINLIMTEVARIFFPNERECSKIDSLMDRLLRDVDHVISNMNLEIHVKTEIVGSAAKNTYLKEADIDLFLLFPATTPEKRTGEICFLIGKEILDSHVVKYASHPYLSGTLDGVGVDVVWAYEVESGESLISAVDRTPFHTRYVNEFLSDERTRDVRLLKQFLKGIELYSASLRVEGISGYLTELLVIRYGSFLDVLTEIAGWGKRKWIELIDIMKGTGSDWNRFPDENLVFIDPVDSKRNVAAALSGDNYYRLISACACFLEAPSMDFFSPAPVSVPAVDELRAVLAERGTSLFSLALPLPNVVDDILYPQIYKAETSLTNVLGKSGFLVLGCQVMVQPYPGKGEKSDPVNRKTGRIHFFLELDRIDLPGAEIHLGPPVHLDNSSDFLAKWSASKDSFSKPYIEGGRWKVIRKRHLTHACGIIESRIEQMNLGKDLDKTLKKGYSLLSGPEMIDQYNRRAIHRLFQRGEFWMR